MLMKCAFVGHKKLWEFIRSIPYETLLETVTVWKHSNDNWTLRRHNYKLHNTIVMMMMMMMMMIIIIIIDILKIKRSETDSTSLKANQTYILSNLRSWKYAIKIKLENKMRKNLNSSNWHAYGSHASTRRILISLLY
jgi:hypothetical protein